MRNEKKVILVADDEAIILESISMYLDSKGYEVITALDGKKALQQFLSNRKDIDLALLDFRMPRMSGDRLMEYFKLLENNLPVVLHTGERDTVFPGADAVIPKPCRLDQIFDAIEQLLEPVPAMAV